MIGPFSRRHAALALFVALVVSWAFKLPAVAIGGPQFMIDDFTLYKAGFLVWFGHAAPQHGWLEGWISGLVSIAVFVARTMTGEVAAGLDRNLVLNAYRDFYQSPDAYYHVYRVFLLVLDSITACLVFRLTRRILGDDLWATVAASLYLFTFNTLWCSLVGRPDILVAFLAVGGVSLYLESLGDWRRPSFWFAAVLLGAATGLKIHAAFFTIFIVVDLARGRSVADWLRRGAAFAAAAVFLFALADGALVFDPLMFVKAKASTYQDDHSLYLRWGSQFRVMLNATNWVLLPLALAGAIRAFRVDNPRLRSVAGIALGWLLVFAAIRQLRGYWMLPATPLFCVLAVAALASVRKRTLAAGIAAAVVVLFAGRLWLDSRAVSPPTISMSCGRGSKRTSDRTNRST